MTTEEKIYRDEQTGKCWHLELRSDEVIILRRGKLAETHDLNGFFELFTEVCP